MGFNLGFKFVFKKTYYSYLFIKCLGKTSHVNYLINQKKKRFSSLAH